MRILILGGSGMLGHRLYQHFAKEHEVKVTLRNRFEHYAPYQIFSPQDRYVGVDVTNIQQLTDVMADFMPEVVINAVGIIIQRPS